MSNLSKKQMEREAHTLAMHLYQFALENDLLDDYSVEQIIEMYKDAQLKILNDTLTLFFKETK